VNIVFYTSGISGIGRLAVGVAIYNALKRNNISCNYSMLTHSPMGYIAQDVGIEHIYIPLEDEVQLSRKNYHKSILYHTVTVLKPDILIVYLQWFTLDQFIHELTCKKIFLMHNVTPNFFSFATQYGEYEFNPKHYHYCFAIEPFNPPFEAKAINPLIMKNHDEILPKKEAKEKLQLPLNKKICLISISGNEHEFDDYVKKYTIELSSEYDFFVTSNHEDQNIFPIIDYFNAFDCIVCGAGYNSFWETRFFTKKAYTIPLKRVFEDQSYRVKHFSNYTFTRNGADQLVELLV